MFRRVFGRAPPLPPTNRLTANMNAHISDIRNLSRLVKNKAPENVVAGAQKKLNNSGKAFLVSFDGWVRDAVASSLNTMATAPTPEAAVPAAQAVDVLTDLLKALQVNKNRPTPNSIARIQSVLNTPMWRRRYARSANANSQLRAVLANMKSKLNTASRANAELAQARAGYNRAIGFVANQGEGAIINAILGYRNSNNKNRNLLTLIGKSPNHANWNNYFRKANARLKSGPRQAPPPPASGPTVASVMAGLENQPLLARQRQAQGPAPASNNPFMNLNVGGLLSAMKSYNRLGPNNKGKLSRAINNKLATLNPNSSNYEALVRAKNNFAQ